MLKKINKELLISVGLIFVGALFSVWAYGRFEVLHQADISPADKEAVIKCFSGHVDLCGVARAVSEKVRYQMVTIDKLALLAVSFLISLYICREFSFWRNKRLWGAWIILFLYFASIQYAAFNFNYLVWNFTQDSWGGQPIGIMKEGCFSGGSRADCSALRREMGKIKTVVMIFEVGRVSLFLVASAAVGMILRNGIDKNGCNQKEKIK